MSDPKRHPLPAISRPSFDDRTETDRPDAPRLPAITPPKFDDKTELDTRTELATVPGSPAPDKPPAPAPPAPGAPGAAAPPASRLPQASLDPAAYAGRGLDDLMGEEPISGIRRSEVAIDAHGRLVTPGRKPMTTPSHGLPDADLLSVGVEAWPSAPDPATQPFPAAPPLPRPPERREPPRAPPRMAPSSGRETPKPDGSSLPPLRRDVPARPQPPPVLEPPRLEGPDRTPLEPSRLRAPDAMPAEPPTRPLRPAAIAQVVVEYPEGPREEAPEEPPEDPGPEPESTPARPRRGAWLAVKVALALILLGGGALYLAVNRPGPLASLLEGPAPTLEIRSRPNGATVTINGEVVGTTPLVRENRYPTDRDTEIQVSHRGYKTWTWKFRGGKSFALEVELRR